MKLLLIDIDDTLIQTTKFRLELVKKFDELGVKNSEEIYSQIRTSMDVPSWIDLYCELLARDHELSAEYFKKVYLETLQNIQVNEPVVEFLKNFEGTKVIYSFGNHELQQLKLETTNLTPHFDHTLVATQNKVDYLTSFISPTTPTTLILGNTPFTDVTLVDDRYIEEYKKNYPWFKVIDVREIINHE